MAANRLSQVKKEERVSPEHFEVEKNRFHREQYTIIPRAHKSHINVITKTA